MKEVSTGKKFVLLLRYGMVQPAKDSGQPLPVIEDDEEVVSEEINEEEVNDES